MNKVIIIILGGGTNGLGQIRSAHQAGYECINIVERGLHSWSRKSKYCKGYIAPHPYNDRNDCLNFLLKVIKSLSAKPFLLFASDDWMDLIGENEPLFRDVSFIPQSHWNILSQLYNKKYLYRIAEKIGIPYPKTIEVEKLEDIEGLVNNIKSPYIVKPQTTVSQNEITKCGIVFFHRTQKFESKEKLMEWVKILLDSNINFPVLIQEFIPGNATTLYTMTSYSDSIGNLIACSVGHKLRQFPPGAGRITSGILEFNQDIIDLGKKLTKQVCYHGLANIEFKFDERDGKYKLMEINTRLGAWNYSALYSGINLVKIAVDNTLSIKYSGLTYVTTKDGAIWYNLVLDMFAVLFLNKKIGERDYRLSYVQWKKSLGKTHFEAIWDKNDIKPFIFNLFYLFKEFLVHKSLLSR